MVLRGYLWLLKVKPWSTLTYHLILLLQGARLCLSTMCETNLKTPIFSIKSLMSRLNGTFVDGVLYRCAVGFSICSHSYCANLELLSWIGTYPNRKKYFESSEKCEHFRSVRNIWLWPFQTLKKNLLLGPESSKVSVPQSEAWPSIVFVPTLK